MQKACRESYLLVQVNAFDIEKLNAPNAFSALCNISSDSVNELVDASNHELKSIITSAYNPLGDDADEEEKTRSHNMQRFYYICVLAIFIQRMRCKYNFDVTIRTFHDDTYDNLDIFIVSEYELYLVNDQMLHGPFDDVHHLCAFWINASGLNFDEITLL